jgi:hypothetical protein
MEEIPKAVWEGEFTLGPITLKCAVLDNGQRIIEQESVDAFMAWLFDPGSDKFSFDEEQMEKFNRWRTGDAELT